MFAKPAAIIRTLALFAAAVIPVPNLFSQEKPAPMKRAVRSLSELMPQPEPLILRYAVDSRDLPLAVPWRASQPVVRLEIPFQNSGALAAEQSQMVLSWSDNLITQLPLDGEKADGRLIAEIPPRLLGDRNSNLQLRVIHRTKKECDKPFADDLWTQIDPHDAFVTLDYRLRRLDPVLSDLPRLLDRRSWGAQQLHLVTAIPGALTEDHLKNLARITERVALMLGNVPLQVKHRYGSLSAKGDHLLVGLREEIAPVLPESIALQLTDSFVGIFPHPADDRYFITVISGKDDDGLAKAVRAFSAPDFSLPPDRGIDLTDLRLPEMPAVKSRRFRPGESRTLAELGFETRVMKGATTGTISVPVFLPPGLNPNAPEQAEIRLRMAWTPVREDASVNVLVNGRPQATIAIGKSKTSMAYDLAVPIALGAFQAGENWISLQPNLIPPFADNCRSIDWDQVRFVLHDDSRFLLPETGLSIALPDLALTARGGLPVLNPEGDPFVVQLGTRDSASLSAACTVFAKLVQQTGQRLPAARMSFRLPPEDSHYLVVGIRENLPSNLLPPGFEVSEADKSAKFLQFQSPRRAGRIGMVVEAADADELSAFSHEIVLPHRWAQLSGHEARWKRDAASLAIDSKVFAGFRFETQGPEVAPGLPSALLPILCLSGGLTALAWIGWGLLRRWKRRRPADRLPGLVSIDVPLWSVGNPKWA